MSDRHEALALPLVETGLSHDSLELHPISNLSHSVNELSHNGRLICLNRCTMPIDFCFAMFLAPFDHPHPDDGWEVVACDKVPSQHRIS